MKQNVRDYGGRLIGLLNRYVIISHIFLSLAVCFIMEWLSRHSFLSAYFFTKDHTGAYIYNSYVIFLLFLPVILIRRRTFLRMVILAILMIFGIANCIILINRVTPFGFTDLNMITDLLTMQNTSYFTAQQAMISLAAFLVYTVLMVLLFRYGRKQEPRLPFSIRLASVILMFALAPVVTKTLITNGVLTSYFGNLAQGYLDYGYVYGFGTSMLGRGMKKPADYNETKITALIHDTDRGPSTITTEDEPNIIIVLLESFFDVSEAEFIRPSNDPIPFFHQLEQEYSTGHLTVPVVGAGTCNTEFEILTGMSCQFFGPGEYPQKTILKKTDVESVASDLATIGYHSHVVHNNGGNFYSRANAFSMMGFDSFTCKEMLDITDYTPIASWATDDILVGATEDSLESTPGADFIYTITVEAHGDYPKEKVEENPAVTVKCRGKDEALTNMWEYYTNRIHCVDEFLQDYVDMLSKRDEKTLLICFGDHLPTMGLYEHEVKTGDLYQTKYITWNNFGMEKKDQDLTSYQLASTYLDRLGIHDGTIVDYNQTMTEKKIRPQSNKYMHGLNLLQYDLLYGKRFSYGQEDLYPASRIMMGSHDIHIDSAYQFDGDLHIYGDRFSKWSRVYVNGERVPSEYKSGQCLTVDLKDVKPGDLIAVNQVGSSSTVFRSSNLYRYHGTK